MKLKPGGAAEYQRRHDALWPELARALRTAGISDYSIFLDAETLTLFAVQQQTDDSTASNCRIILWCGNGGITWRT